MEIKELLKQKNMTQAQLARKIGIDPSLLSRLLTGKRPWKSEHLHRAKEFLSENLNNLSIIDLVIEAVDALKLDPKAAANVISDMVKCCVVTGMYPSVELARKMSLVTR